MKVETKSAARGQGQATAQPSAGSAVRSVVLGTAGHIDHGKTALVLALTGTDTDRLPEEKARGITIDLGFAALDLTGSGGERFDVSLVDVPGHHAFVRNMLAGAGGIDAVMLVVAADEGVKAQTVEHLAICRLLGIPRGVVVLTKRDAVNPERLEAARSEVAALVQGTFLEGAPVLAVSALKREGIPELKAALARLASQTPRRNADQVARLPVDRVFSVKGFGTVVTGTLQAGTLRSGQSLTLQPGERAVRVRGVQVHGKARGEAGAPNRVALNVAGVDVAGVNRGDTVVPEGTLEPVTILDASFESLAGAPELRHRQHVRVHAFASESLATVLLYPTGASEQGGAASLVRLRLARPMLLVPGDRFVLRQPSPALTVGGGVVLDAQPLPRLRKKAAEQWLRTLQGTRPAEAIALRVRRREENALALGRLVAETGLTRPAIEALVKPALASRALVAIGDLLIGADALTRAQDRLAKEIERAKDHSLTRAELRSRSGLGERVFGLALEHLQAAKRLLVAGDSVRTPGQEQRAAADGEGNARTAEVEKLYRAAGLASPIVSEAAERLGLNLTEVRGRITALLRAGKLVRLGSDTLLVHGEALERLTAQLREHRGQSFDVGRFKTLTGLSRKHAIPLLEYLDGARVTRNVGGVRTVI